MFFPIRTTLEENVLQDSKTKMEVHATGQRAEEPKM
jgi:hypothetical protein